MAKAWKKTNLKLVYTYQNEDFKDCTKSKTYSHVNKNASDVKLYEIAECIASMQQYMMVEAQEVITSELTE